MLGAIRSIYIPYAHVGLAYLVDILVSSTETVRFSSNHSFLVAGGEIVCGVNATVIG